MSQKQALIFGTTGALGNALAQHLSTHYNITGIVRAENQPNSEYISSQLTTDYSEASLESLSSSLSEQGQQFDLILNTIGILHSDNLKPEKRLLDISQNSLEQYFHSNTIVPALLLKHFHTLLPKRSNSVFASLSAKVGSIEDNHLGGWYGYRASKAALNMLIKTAAIEVGRTRKQAAIVAIHPGTTIGRLSAPYTQNTPKDKLFSPELSAQRISRVLDNLSAKDSGGFFNWSGEKLPW